MPPRAELHVFAGCDRVPDNGKLSPDIYKAIAGASELESEEGTRIQSFGGAFA